jgi:hypothetical protein
MQRHQASKPKRHGAELLPIYCELPRLDAMQDLAELSLLRRCRLQGPIKPGVRLGIPVNIRWCLSAHDEIDGPRERRTLTSTAIRYASEFMIAR